MKTNPGTDRIYDDNSSISEYLKKTASREHMIYLYSCPNCGDNISDRRLFGYYVCEKCLPEELKGEISLERVIKVLRKRGALRGLSRVKEVMDRLREFELIFKEALGSEPWSAQRAWAMRVFKGKSFSIVAPTGVGKTVFGLIMSLYLAGKGKRYIVLPTTPLVLQAEEKLRGFIDAICNASEAERKNRDVFRKVCSDENKGPRVLVFHSKLKRKEREDRLERLQRGEFDILVTTSRFMLKNVETISNHKFQFMFIDDVDSVLRSGKSVEAVMRVLGLNVEDINAAQETIDEMRKVQAEIERKNRELAAPVSSRGKEKRKRLEELWEELVKQYDRLIVLQERLNEIRNKIRTILVVSTATGRPRGPRILLFRGLLGFQPGSRPELLRNISDTYLISREENIADDVIDVVKKLGGGGLVYVPVDRGIPYALELAERLKEAGVRAEAFYHKKQDALSRFVNGEIDVLVGVAIYYGIMVRGLDYPQRIRYAVFAGFPRFKFSARFEEPHPLNIYRILEILSDIAPPHEAEKASELLRRIRRFLRQSSPAAIQVLSSKLKSGSAPVSSIEQAFVMAAELIRRMLQDPRVIEALKASKEIIIREERGQMYFYIPDLMTYIQASGRTSRLYVGGLTKGLSVVVVDDKALFDQAKLRLRMIFDGMVWRELDELKSTGELERILRQIDEDREKVAKAVRGEYRPGEKIDLVKTYLMVVESPNKARTISRFFGRPSVRILGDGLRSYEVSLGNIYLIIVASGGHVYDLVTDDKDTIPAPHASNSSEIFHGIIVKNGRDFIPVYTSIRTCRVCGLQVVNPKADKCPRCKSSYFLDKRNVIEHLRDLALECDAVLIATDPDTEGEKIGWDLAALLRPYAREIRRAEFHEVTRRAILEALERWRDLNVRQVEAQLVRRIEDRWIGFTLSPKLWKDFWQDYYCKKERVLKKARQLSEEECKQENRRLSAGRVQTPVLGWIIERYDMSEKSKKKYLEVTLDDYDRLEFSQDEIPENLISRIREGTKIKIRERDRYTEEISPLPPYTTDTLIYDASRYLKFSATYTMSLAQDLFELGLITYHRTDSTRVSDVGIELAKEYLQTKNPELFRPRNWSTGPEGAHEAIRPTRPIDEMLLRRMIDMGEIELARPLTRAHYMLYGLIFDRFIASQCDKAVVKVQEIEITLPKRYKIKKKFYIDYEKEGFITFYRYYPIFLRKSEFREGEYIIKEVREKLRKTVFPYTQGEVVSEMKKKGIGRPSTYATIINKLLSRNYVYSRGKTGGLAPTELGRDVYEYLIDKFSELVSEDRTRELEMKMDLVSEGKISYIEVLKNLYEEISRYSHPEGIALGKEAPEESVV